MAKFASAILSRLKPDQYRLWAWRGDWTTKWTPYRDNVDVRGGKVTEGVDITLVPGVIVQGRVLEEGTRRPIRAAVVEFARLQFATTDEEGHFRLEGIPEGLINVAAKATGFARHWFPWTWLTVRNLSSPSNCLREESSKER